MSFVPIRVLICAGFALVQASCATQQMQKNALQAQRDAVRADIENEVTIGRNMAAQLLAMYPLDPEPNSRKYVNLVGLTLASQVGRPEIQFHFAVLKTSDLNAYACPGGYVFITRGLLDQVRSESELAAVLSHEIAHVNLRHLYQTLISEQKMTVTEWFARLFSRG